MHLNQTRGPVRERACFQTTWFRRTTCPDRQTSLLRRTLRPDGSVVLQSETEAVLANLDTGKEHVAYSLSETMVHGIVEDSTGTTAFCVSVGDTLMAIFAGASASTSIAMPENVCGGMVAVCGDTVVAFNQDHVVVNFPLQSPVYPWRAPRIEHFIRCRHGPPLIVLADQSTWRPTKTEAGGARCLPWTCIFLPRCARPTSTLIWGSR